MTMTLFLLRAHRMRTFVLPPWRPDVVMLLLPAAARRPACLRAPPACRHTIDVAILTWKTVVVL